MRERHYLADEPLIRSFWSQVDMSSGPDGCWLWTGLLSLDGFPRFVIPGMSGRQRAARMAYQLQYGPLEPGMVVWQRPEERFCVNPAHLLVGTRTDRRRTTRTQGKWPSDGL